MDTFIIGSSELKGFTLWYSCVGIVVGVVVSGIVVLVAAL